MELKNFVILSSLTPLKIYISINKAIGYMIGSKQCATRSPSNASKTIKTNHACHLTNFFLIGSLYSAKNMPTQKDGQRL